MFQNIFFYCINYIISLINWIGNLFRIKLCSCSPVSPLHSRHFNILSTDCNNINNGPIQLEWQCDSRHNMTISTSLFIIYSFLLWHVEMGLCVEWCAANVISRQHRNYRWRLKTSEMLAAIQRSGTRLLARDDVCNVFLHFSLDLNAVSQP